MGNRIRVVAQSMKLHRDHCLLLQKDHHFATLAAAHAKPLIGCAAYDGARRLHRAANCAKHDALFSETLLLRAPPLPPAPGRWADVESDTSAGPSPEPSDEDLDHPPPASCGDLLILNPSAPDFVPLLARIEASEKTIKLLLNLLETQKEHIQHLTDSIPLLIKSSLLPLCDSIPLLVQNFLDVASRDGRLSKKLEHEDFRNDPAKFDNPKLAQNFPDDASRDLPKIDIDVAACDDPKTDHYLIDVASRDGPNCDAPPPQALNNHDVKIQKHECGTSPPWEDIHTYWTAPSTGIPLVGRTPSSCPPRVDAPPSVRSIWCNGIMIEQPILDNASRDHRRHDPLFLPPPRVTNNNFRSSAKPVANMFWDDGSEIKQSLIDSTMRDHLRHARLPSPPPRVTKACPASSTSSFTDRRLAPDAINRIRAAAAAHVDVSARPLPVPVP